MFRIIRVLHGCGNADITAVYHKFHTCGNEYSHSCMGIGDVRWVYCTREYHGNGNSFTGITAGAVHLFICLEDNLNNWILTYW